MRQGNCKKMSSETKSPNTIGSGSRNNRKNDLIKSGITCARGFNRRTFRATMLTFWRTPVWTPFLRGTSFLRRTRVRSWPIISRTLIGIGATHLTRLPLTPIGLSIQRTIRLPVSRSRSDFEFVQLIPLFFSAIPLGDGKKFANPATRINS